MTEEFSNIWAARDYEKGIKIFEARAASGNNENDRGYSPMLLFMAGQRNSNWEYRNRAFSMALRLLEEKPDLFGAHMVIGWVLMKGKLFIKASEHFRRALLEAKVRIEKNIAQTALIQSLIYKGDGAAALQLIAELEEEGALTPAVQFFKVMALRKEHQYKEAFEQYAVLRGHSQNAPAMEWVAIALRCPWTFSGYILSAIYLAALGIMLFALVVSAQSSAVFILSLIVAVTTLIVACRDRAKIRRLMFERPWSGASE